jgi:hypothetical protein
MTTAKRELLDLIDSGDACGWAPVHAPAELPLVWISPAPDGVIGIANAGVAASNRELLDDRISVRLGRGEIFRRRPIASEKRDHRARERSNP